MPKNKFQLKGSLITLVLCIAVFVETITEGCSIKGCGVIQTIVVNNKEGMMKALTIPSNKNQRLLWKKVSFRSKK